MMFPGIIIVPLVFAIPAAVVFARMWFTHKEKMARMGDGASAGVHPALEARLDRLDQAVEAIAVEMERMGEGQRFVTKLLSDRSALAGPGPSAPGRVITPH